MTARMPISRHVACILTLAATVLAASPAQAEIDSALIALNIGTGDFIRSVSVTTMSIVTSPGKESYIEIFFATETDGLGLRIMSKDQRRIEAFYNQILQATAAHQQFQITAYTIGTFQPKGYVASLDAGLTYFILY
jgi:hypothetical protein